MWFRKNHLSPGSEDAEQYKFKRVWHHHERCEDVINGMWASVHGKERKMMLENSIDFTGDHALYGHYMLKVIEEWPVACEHNLTSPLNRKAWVGHAACCYALGIPEDITREAWSYLSGRQRNDANRQAMFAIKTWERNYAKNLSRSECLRCGERADINHFRPIQQNLFEFFWGKGQHRNASPCNG